MKKHIQILFFLISILNCSNFWTQKEPEDKIELIYFYDSIAYEYRFTQTDSSLYYIGKIITICKEISDTNNLAYSYTFYGTVKKDQGEIDSAIFYFKKAIEIQKSIDFDRGIAGNYNNIANAYRKQNNYLSSIEYYQKSKIIFDKVQDDKNSAITLQNISELYLEMNQPNEALNVLLQAEKKLLKNENKVGLGYFYVTKAEIFNRLKNDQEVLSLMLQSLNLFEEVDHQSEVCRIRIKLGKFWINNNSYYKADSVLSLSLNQSFSLNQKYEWAQSHLYLGELNNKLNNHAKAVEFLEIAIDVSEKYKFNQLLAEAYKMIATSYYLTQNYKSSFEALSISHKIQDSIMGYELQKSFKELQTKYKVLEKDNQIAMQNADNERLQFEKKSEETKNFYIIIVTILVVLLLMIFVLRFIQKRKLSIQLEQSLRERELLLKEIHHRVKNNLQIISSLLNLQKRASKTEVNNELINQTQDRIQTMAIIHENLYQSDNFVDINLKTYFDNLLNHFENSYALNNKHIILNQKIEPFSLHIDKLIPLGLILNELLTNSVKYAFDENGGEILIDIHKEKEDEVTFVYQDNGKGLPEDFDIKKSKSLGMQLIKGLSKQIKGTLEIKSIEGLKICITFKL